MTQLDYYWASKKEWRHWDGEKLVVNDDAPEDAKKSYEHYLKQKQEKGDYL